MTKKIVLCFDGSWNDPDSQTNVIKMYRSICGVDKSPDRVGVDVPAPSVHTIKWYDKGVGTKCWNKLRGGVTGRGLTRNILEGYQFLARNYEIGDDIYLFGFSRGAYTARSLAGMIRNVGLLHERYAREEVLEDNPVLMNGFRLYQKRDGSPRHKRGLLFQEKILGPVTSE